LLRVVLGQQLEQDGGTLERAQLLGVEAVQAARQVGGPARAAVAKRLGAVIGQRHSSDPAIGGIGLAGDEARVDEKADDARRRRPPDPLDARELARCEGAVALDRRQRGSLRRGQSLGAVLAKAARETRDGQAQARGKLELGSGYGCDCSSG
jgi:hypothetical protein